MTRGGYQVVLNRPIANDSKVEHFGRLQVLLHEFCESILVLDPNPPDERVANHSNSSGAGRLVLCDLTLAHAVLVDLEWVAKLGPLKDPGLTRRVGPAEQMVILVELVLIRRRSSSEPPIPQ
ncbi:MAG: hypothetical protein ACI89X_000827 [Planctomycetota bacterium]|jgi:hypothetical protein